MLLTPLLLQPNDAGTKLHHPALSSEEVLAAVNLAGAAYANDTSDLASYFEQSEFDFGLDGWTTVTDQLLDYGLDGGRLVNDLYYQATSASTGFVSQLFPGTSEAIVFRNSTTDDVALAFRGTAPFTDAVDWSEDGRTSHYNAFVDLFTALDTYIADTTVERLLVAGHSLGGAMTEMYMSMHPDTPEVEYEAVAVGSPIASFTDDSRILNIGHESDIVYSISPGSDRNENAVADLNAVFDRFLVVPDFAEIGDQHSIATSYRHTTETLLQSQFYTETTRESRVILALTNQTEEIERVAEDIFVDDPAVVLGRNKSVTLADGTVLSADDFLVGGASDDYLEGFAGNDVLRGDAVLLGEGGKDTLAGGAGADLFLGTPGELDGDTIVDLEIGDRIGLIRETVVQEDLTLTSGAILIDADDGFFDFFGREVTIHLTNPLPPGAGLRVLEETLEDGGSIIEVFGTQDLVFVIDTTGSMHDDIAAVKESATEIINRVLRDGSDNRVGIVLYRDHGDEYVSTTQLPFTADRNTVLGAIQSITVDGGGDWEEAVFSGLIHAIDGHEGLGHWRGGNIPKNIILMGDAPPKDPEPVTGYTQQFVDERAGAGGVEIDDGGVPQSLDRAALDTGADSAVPPSVTEDTRLPVNIHTILIETSEVTREVFEDLSAKTGGSTFLAPTAADVVGAVLDAVETTILFPIPAGPTPVTVPPDITGIVYHDVNRNGEPDPGEERLSGWTVELLQTSEVEGSIGGEPALVSLTTVSPTTTMGDPLPGFYIFADPAEGEYSVRAVPPPGWKESMPETPERAAWELDQSMNIRATDNDFRNWGGLDERWVLSDNGWLYVTPDGTLHMWDSDADALSGRVLATLSPLFHEDLTLLTHAVEPAANVFAFPEGELSTEVNFGFYIPSAISGRKWEDANANGVRDEGEAWLNGWMMELVDATDGTVISTTTTDDIDLNSDGRISPETERGVYEFNSLLPGEFFVREVQQTGWIQSSLDAAAQVAFDLDTDLNLQTTANDFFNWGGRNERWLSGDPGWYYITEDGVLFDWDGSGPDDLTGNEVAVLTSHYHRNLNLLTDAEAPRVTFTVVDENVFRDVNFGSYRTDGISGVSHLGLAGLSGDPGNVSARRAGRNYFITGDGADNQVAITVTTGGDVVVSGLHGTTVNGESSFLVMQGQSDFPWNLNVQMQGGDDFVSLSGITTTNHLNINLGSGDDRAAVTEVKTGGNLTINGGSGANLISVDDSHVSNNFTANGSGQSDWLLVTDVIVSNHSFVRTYGGDDFVYVRDSSFHDNATLHTGGGDDAVVLRGQNSLQRHATVNGATGTDMIDHDSESDLTSLRSFLRNFEAEAVDAELIDEAMTRLADFGIPFD